MGMMDDIGMSWDSWEDAYDGLPENYHVVPYLEIVARTKKAILFQNENGSFWLPKSIITVNKKAKTVDVPVWCDWKYIDTIPAHPNPRGSTCLTKSGKPKRIKNVTS